MNPMNRIQNILYQHRLRLSYLHIPPEGSSMIYFSASLPNSFTISCGSISVGKLNASEEEAEEELLELAN